MTAEMPPSEVSTTDVHERFEAWLNEDEPAEAEEVKGEEVESEPAEAVDDEPDSDDEQTEEDDEPENSEDDTETLTIEGEEYTLPKAVAEKVNTIKKRLEADYTRKTQEAAEEMRGARELQQRVSQDTAFHQQNTDLLVKWHTIDGQLKDYEGVDWDALYEQDERACRIHERKFEALKKTQKEVGHEFSQRQQFVEHQQAEEYRAQHKAVIATVQKAIPHYDAELDKKAVQTAIRLGEKYGIKVDAQTLSKTLDPLVWIGLVEISKHFDIVDKRPATQKQVAVAPKMGKPTVKPQKSSTQTREQKVQKLLQQGRIREAALL